MKLKHIRIPQSDLHNDVSITLPSSKSISNRALIMSALCKSPNTVQNLSSARDTQTMIRLLKSKDEVLDVLDAGTTMRFLLAYLTVTDQHKTLTGTERMQQRPIGILADALRALGADITYIHNEGFPPIRIDGFSQQKNMINIRGDVSSQYISALLMIAPVLQEGLTLTLEGDIGSRPYIEMTLQMMKSFGIEYQWDHNIIRVAHQQYQNTPFVVEGDWSAASYWYSFVALSEKGSVMLKGMKEESLQGDQSIANIMKALGVNTSYSTDGLSISKTSHIDTTFHYDFTNTPDLAQTVAVVCAAKGISAVFTGLESLKIKETDRIYALQTELAKIGASLIEKENEWILTPSDRLPDLISIHTYEDHRMAMAFAPLCLLMDITFDDQSVVCKSYPSFWEDVERATRYCEATAQSQ